MSDSPTGGGVNRAPEDLALTVGYRSDVGRVRSANEDSLLVVRKTELAPEQQGRGDLFLVADGMGGAVGGARASSIVAQTVLDAVYADTQSPPADALRVAIGVANRNVHADATANMEFRGMGSTCTGLLVVDGAGYVAHVGDSRLYLVREGKILQLSEDHTKIRLLVESGMITAEEAVDHPERSVLLRSIGPKPEVEVDCPPPVRLKPGDTFILCSDGLTNHVGDHEILAMVDDHRPQDAADGLVELANRRGGSDNISVIVVQVGGRRGARRPPYVPPPTVVEGRWRPPSRGRGRLLVGIGFLGAAVLGAVVAAALLGGREGSLLSWPSPPPAQPVAAQSVELEPVREATSLPATVETPKDPQSSPGTQRGSWEEDRGAGSMPARRQNRKADESRPPPAPSVGSKEKVAVMVRLMDKCEGVVVQVWLGTVEIGLEPIEIPVNNYLLAYQFTKDDARQDKTFHDGEISLAASSEAATVKCWCTRLVCTP